MKSGPRPGSAQAVGSALKPALHLFKSFLSMLPPAKEGLTGAAWVGAEVVLGILPSAGTEATSTSYPEQNELKAKA